ncbi:peptidoglycan-recognition protein SD-like [Musca vetustissima]|uniref:peptidoglycan-recognition protein SD-like n=1 Tax=Musca vetustissima TaxID=27455 RepID=UPI002AB7DF5D|nr:peptidoglycan-recognition protein SD-like [Musca vetustissima]
MPRKLFFGWPVFLGALLFAVLGVKGELQIISRAEWKAKPAVEQMTPLELPAQRVIIAHTAGNECKSKAACSAEMRNIQNFHMTKAFFDDIAYNYLIGNDGNVYEGRGWKYQGAIAKGINAGSINIAFMGVFNNQLPSQAALDVVKLLLDKLKTDQKLKEDYKIFGHRQLSPTVSPGDALYAEIQTWPKWSKDL